VAGFPSLPLPWRLALLLLSFSLEEEMERVK